MRVFQVNCPQIKIVARNPNSHQYKARNLQKRREEAHAFQKLRETERYFVWLAHEVLWGAAVFRRFWDLGFTASAASTVENNPAESNDRDSVVRTRAAQKENP